MKIDILLIVLGILGFLLGSLSGYSGYIFAQVQSTIDNSHEYSFVTEWGSKGTSDGQFYVHMI